MAEEKRFFADFPPISTEEWMAKINADLKGVPFEKKLVWKSAEGFDVHPFYRREDIKDFPSARVLPGKFPYVRSTKLDNEWLVREDIVTQTPEEANARALYILYRGVTSLRFAMQEAWMNEKTLEILLEGIDLTAIEINFNCCTTKGVQMLQALNSYCDTHGINKSQITGSVEHVPFKRELVKGKVTPDWISESAAVLEAARDFPKMRVLMVNALFFGNAGAYITQELGLALAWGVELLDTFAEQGSPMEYVAGKIGFNFAVGPNYFMEIAKFRASRWLWAQIVAAHGEEYMGDVAKIYQHATTSTWNMTRYDAYVNLLRTQTETMSAALGGVDSITVLPFDYSFAVPDDFSLRIARNQQLLLLEESHFDKVLDPGAGSYYIEILTQKIAERAWEIFLKVQEAGGFANLVQQGEIQKLINETNEKRHENVARRKESLLGTNEFPNFAERIVDNDAISAKVHRCSVDHSKEKNVEALDFRRGASDFETLRLRTDATEHQPVVFMLTIGNLAMRLARSQFAANFFGCGGFQLIDNLGFDTVEEGVNEAIEKGADIIVVCSSDDEYAQYAPEAYRLINNRCEMVVAGNPSCRQELESLGIKHFIHVKSNVLEELRLFSDIFLNKGKKE